MKNLLPSWSSSGGAAHKPDLSQGVNWSSRKCSFLTFLLFSCFAFINVQSEAQGFGTVEGRIFIDYNNDGIFNANDVPEPGVTIELYDDIDQNGQVDPNEPLLFTQLSNGLGLYTFFVTDGFYALQIDLNDLGPSNNLTTDNIESAIINNGNTEANNDFGFDGDRVGCYAWAASGDRLYVFNRISGNNGIISRTPSNASNIQAMAISPTNGTLWGVNNVPGNNRIGRIDVTNGDFSPLSNPFGTANGTAGPIVLDSVYGITFDYSNGLLYAIASIPGPNALFQIDTVSGSFTPNAFGPGNDYLLVDQSNPLDQVNDDLAFSPINGSIYGLQQDATAGSNGTFVTIDPLTGNVTGLANPGQNNLEGLTASLNGNFFATTGLGGVNPNSLFSIDPTTGQATLIRDFVGVFGDFEACACILEDGARPPLAVDDSATTGENTPVNVNVILNDSDPNNDPLTVSSIPMPPSNGTANIISNQVRYIPNNGFIGRDTMTYEVCDPGGLCDQAFVFINVLNVNDPPVAVDDNATTAEDTDVTIDVQANDFDPDGDSLTTSIVTSPANGTVTVINGDSIVYTPNPNFNGTDQFQYQICDGNGLCSTATVTVTVTPGNDPPIARDDDANTPENTPVTIDVQVNDFDPDGDPFTTTNITQAPNNGTAVIVNNDSVLYTPAAGFSGQDTFRYEICDLGGLCDVAEVEIFVSNTNDRPVAVLDDTTTLENTPVTVPVLNNDFDPNNDPLTVTIVTNPVNGVAVLVANEVVYTPNPGFFGFDTLRYEICDPSLLCDQTLVLINVLNVNDPPIAVDDNVTTPEDVAIIIDVQDNDLDPDGLPLTTTIFTAPVNGTVTVLNGDSTFYVPNPNYNGVDSFTYIISDNIGQQDTALVTITIPSENDPPIAFDDARNTFQGVGLVIDVQANDFDPDGDPILTSIVTGPTNGTFAILNQDSIAYQPNPSFYGIEVFQYRVCDVPFGACDTANVTITVLRTNDPPIAVNDFATTPIETPVDIDILANDFSLDLDPLILTSVTEFPRNGTVLLNMATEEATYVPGTGFIGQDTFRYEICDGFGACDQAEVVITIDQSVGPIAVDDTVIVTLNTPLSINVLVNDYHPDGLDFDITSIPAAGVPMHGTAVIEVNSNVLYTPDQGYIGQDTFTYEICDEFGQCDRAEVFITILPENNPPIARDDNYSTLVGLPVTMDVMENDSDPDGDDLTLTALLSFPGNGTITFGADDSLVYTPDADFIGLDQFVYEVCDFRSGCDSATVRITVTPIGFSLPTGYTPNDDGFNDAYIIPNISFYPNNHFLVYNRWGNLIYDERGYSNSWRGQNNAGEFMPDGTYFVVLRVNGDEFEESTYVDMRR